MAIASQGGDRVLMVKCREGYALWPTSAGAPMLDSELYRPSIDTSSIFVWVKKANAMATAGMSRRVDARRSHLRGHPGPSA